MTVASVLLFLLGAFAIDPPEYRCRTQSTRNRQARTVRLDDHDGDHNRWHEYGLDNSKRDSRKQMAVVPATAIVVAPPGSPGELLQLFDLPAPSLLPSIPAIGRSPPYTSQV